MLNHSLLDNAPNYLIGCTVQKMFNKNPLQILFHAIPKNMANFELFCSNISSCKHLLFLKSARHNALQNYPNMIIIFSLHWTIKNIFVIVFKFFFAFSIHLLACQKPKTTKERCTHTFFNTCKQDVVTNNLAYISFRPSSICIRYTFFVKSQYS